MVNLISFEKVIEMIQTGEIPTDNQMGLYERVNDEIKARIQFEVEAWKVKEKRANAVYNGSTTRKHGSKHHLRGR